LVNCIFQENFGGGMNNGGNPTLINCDFLDNWKTTGVGGGIANGGSPTLINCTFSGNSPSGLSNSLADAPVLINCAFSGNAAENGGGMRNSRSDPRVINCTFTENSADDQGGGMYNYDSSPELTNCTFNGNSADYGGGIFNTWNSAPKLANCSLAGNLATGIGGGMYNYRDTSPALGNCTFRANSAPVGKGIACNSPRQDYPSTVELSNCILWNGGDEIWNNDDSIMTVSYSSIEDEDPNDEAVYPGQGNIDDDPLFVRSPSDGGDGWGDDPSTSDVDEGANDDYGDLRIQAGSPCTDAGDNTAVPPDTSDLDGDGDTVERTPLDLGGNLRFTDDCLTEDTGVTDPPDYLKVVDMGAYEYQPNDTDDDGDVDLRNLADLQTCFTGEGPDRIVLGCENFDADCDGDLDLHDFAAFRVSILHP
jgi:parallel beta-helix repeat protein